jgi:dimethylaniline monooxygenase (N-oxide forming)
MFAIHCTMSSYAPSFLEKVLDLSVKKVQDQAFNILPEWRTSPTVSLVQSTPIVSDSLVDALREGTIRSVVMVRKIVGANDVELCDGTRLKVDSIVFCTGYRPDFSFLGELDPTVGKFRDWSGLEGLNTVSPPRLYQNMFSREHPDSLAFVGTALSTTAAFLTCDLASMAIAQVWKGKSSLPSQYDMDKAIDAHYEWVRSLVVKGSVNPFIVKPGPWMRWVNSIAGTGVNEKLGYGFQGWKYWLFHRRICTVLMNGPFSPHIYRLFEGKRRAWKGAEAAIMEVNSLAGALG